MREKFEKYLFETNQPGSGRASSYLKAIQYLEVMIARVPFGFADCESIYAVEDITRIEELVVVVRDEQKKDSSRWAIEGIPASYLAGGYCSAALGAYITFLAEYEEQIRLLSLSREHTGTGAELAQKLNSELLNPGRFHENISTSEGQDVLREIKTRRNQNVFRSIVSGIYGGECCITGLSIAALNRASHIVPWSEDKSIRLNPCNGLFLSATYDAAFDRNLLTLDEDYRMMVSKCIRDLYSNEAVSTYFQKIEGTQITLPDSYLPDQKYLAKHRDKLL